MDKKKLYEKKSMFLLTPALQFHFGAFNIFTSRSCLFKTIFIWELKRFFICLQNFSMKWATGKGGYDEFQ